VQSVLSNNFVRGAVSGIGAVNVLGALSDLAALLTRKPAS